MNLLGYNIFCGDQVSVLAHSKGVINTINPHSYILARKDYIFQKALKASDFLLPDGVGMVIAAKVLTGRKIKKISGFDLHEIILYSLEQYQGSCFYLGSSEGTLLKIKERLAKEHPGIRFGSFSPPFRSSFSEDDSILMRNLVKNFNPDVLFVGMTAPKQEKWVYENKSLMKAPLICSIGAVFDFYAGTVKRSGKFWISIGLEWLPRLMKEPFRLWSRTFISAPQFLLLVFYEKVKMMFTASKTSVMST